LTKFERARDSLWLMVLVALAIRLVATAFLYPEQLPPSGDHIWFGYEVGRIARSLALGHGFRDPLYGPTGPTAWMAPVYPLLLAGIFKLFGIYTRAAALAILSLDSLFSALTCLPVFYMARRSFGTRVGAWAGWMWALYPYGIYLAAERIWDHSLTTLLLSILVALGLRLADSSSLKGWLGFGLLWGVAALTNPVVLSVLPFLGAWICWRLHRQGRRWLQPSAAAALVFVLIVSPWFVRNHRVFHQFIPFRDVFWLAFQTANTTDTWERWAYWTHPAGNKAELDRMAQMGEPAYMELKKREALAFVHQHPKLFAELTVRRLVNVWTGAWNFSPGYLIAEDFEVANILIYTTWTALMLVGLRHAWRRARSAAVPYLLVLFSFPLVLYLTSQLMRYRHPIDPEIIILAVYGVIVSGDLARGRLAAPPPRTR
jgi:4-amino-4-deoxy-L-arabinose transferase-like glycosyltransferase